MNEMVGRVFRKIRLALYSSVRSFDDFERSDPRYQNIGKLCGQCREELRPVYEHYVKEVSRADMAASLELGGLLLALCRTNRWRRLLDLGSGFSSFVFRYYARENPAAVVFSVDDDSDWLKRTRGFLESHQLKKENLIPLQDFLNQGVGSFDCILHDLNFVEVRIEYVEKVLALLAPEGLAIFDDVHKADYRLSLMKQLKSHPGKVFSLKPVTLDRFGRFACVFSPAAK